MSILLWWYIVYWNYHNCSNIYCNFLASCNHYCDYNFLLKSRLLLNRKYPHAVYIQFVRRTHFADKYGMKLSIDTISGIKETEYGPFLSSALVNKRFNHQLAVVSAKLGSYSCIEQKISFQSENFRFSKPLVVIWSEF